MQLRFSTGHTSADYVSRQGWRDASLTRCPHHPSGGCALARHGTYLRKTPAGTRVARWYCPQSHTTFSLLPDCLAARLPGSLNYIEDVVAIAEQSSSLEAAADQARDNVELPGAVRWLRRRVQRVQRCLLLAIGLQPARFAGCRADISSFRRRLGHDAVLMALRGLVDPQLPALPSPLGFSPPASPRGDPSSTRQQPMGPDPPRRYG